MSVEGELKKRIEPFIIEDSWEEPDGGGYTTNHAVIFEVLDEAKKEFLNDVCYSCKTEKSCPPCYKHEEWFKKWFGTEEIQK